MSLNHKRIVSFARKRVGNRAKENNILQELLPRFAAIVPEDGGVIEKLTDLFANSGNNMGYSSYVLEIGFGSGENILSMANKNPNIGYVGCEVFTGGVVTLLEDIRESKIENIRIWHDDALELISRLPLNSLSLIYILHPDPWPKRKHNKRRLINTEFLQLLASKMAKEAKLLMITDHADYAKHIATTIPEVADIFDCQFNDYPEIIKTKYRLKAEAQGIESQYFCLLKK